MIFELHITVNTNNIQKFKNDCKFLNVKPIVIGMELIGEKQVMTSSKHSSENYHIVVDELTTKIKNLGYDILRVKVEKYPDMIKDKNHIYYESHLRVVFVKELEYMLTFILL